MTPKIFPTLTGIVLAALLGLQTASAQDAGVEVLARGPVHEAYAEPADSAPAPSPVVPKPPPKLIEEVPPDQRPDLDGVQWMPGYWGWDEEKQDFLWVSGFWRVPPPGRQWVPGSWRAATGGYQWAPGFWANTEQPEQQYLPPPPATVESGPSVPPPGEDYFYSPGVWVYRDTRYVWRPGVWCHHRPGWVWVAAHYRWTPCGYVLCGDYWDLTLATRGCLFAPCYIDFNVCYRPGWCYTPRYVVYDECLTGALFVRPGFGCYYFGDYFGASYTRLGYRSWFNVSIGVGHGYHYDPLYSYYAVEYRSRPAWHADMRALYVGRYNGTIAPPPRTLVQQNIVIKNTTVNNVRNVTMIGSLNQVQAASNGKLKPVAADQRADILRTNRQFHEAAQKRTQVESQLVAKGPIPTAGAAPRKATLDLPKSFAGTAPRKLAPMPPPSPIPGLTGKPPAGNPFVPPKPPLKLDLPTKSDPPAKLGPPKLPGDLPAGSPKPSNLAPPGPPAKFDPKSIFFPSSQPPSKKPDPKKPDPKKPDPKKPIVSSAPSGTIRAANHSAPTRLTPPPAPARLTPPTAPLYRMTPPTVNRNSLPLTVRSAPQSGRPAPSHPAPARPATEKKPDKKR